MPHLSPLKWLKLHIFLMPWMILFLIKLNFLFIFYPDIHFKTPYFWKTNKKFILWKI